MLLLWRDQLPLSTSGSRCDFLHWLLFLLPSGLTSIHLMNGEKANYPRSDLQTVTNTEQNWRQHKRSDKELKEPERGDAMSLTAALRGFVVLLCCFSAVKSQRGWEVKYYETEKCANKGSTVIILCSYGYPEKVNKVYTTVKKSFWFIRTEGEPVDLKEDPEYKDRVIYSYSPKICHLRISGVRESDSAVYKFRFITNHQSGRYIGEPGVRLTVRDLQVLLVSTSVQQEHSDVQLKCFNRCDPDGLEEYVWFINGEETRSRIQSETSQTFLYRSWNSSTDRISCSLRSSKTDQSPEVCEFTLTVDHHHWDFLLTWIQCLPQVQC
ncbi:uncharacterized protein LOC112157206 [Oryzias melastigma]|uniref:uncharacterized protein LOC112157206 n=1 Tax=Oryzias melastigma TaxID=30732 RepID=UPI00168D0F4F|nr:uncharacterized protein LOC112157206 [Oryzias melastigma]